MSVGRSPMATRHRPRWLVVVANLVMVAATAAHLVVDTVVAGAVLLSNLTVVAALVDMVVVTVEAAAAMATLPVLALPPGGRGLTIP